MKRIFYILFIIFPLQLNFLFSQNNPGKLLLDVSILASRNAVGGLTYDAIEGSPYHSDAFINSIVYLKNGDHYSLPLRYDLFQDEIEFKQDGNILWLYKKDISYIQYSTEVLLPELFSEDSDKLTYFFVLGEGEYALYTRKKVNFYPYVPPQAYTEAVPNRFEREIDQYYLKQKGMPAKEISSKKALSKILGDNETALDFIKKSKIKVNNAEDLLKLVNFLNNQ